MCVVGGGGGFEGQAPSGLVGKIEFGFLNLGLCSCQDFPLCLTLALPLLPQGSYDVPLISSFPPTAELGHLDSIPDLSYCVFSLR